jgi:DNA-binding NtrC family response regulator
MIPGLILVVDDQKRQRETLVQVLEQWGHEVRQAEDGQTALVMVKGEPVDLILTDLRMPGLSGLELLEKCRELRPDIAVIVMTAYGTIEGAVEAMRKGALDFCAAAWWKPPRVSACWGVRRPCGDAGGGPPGRPKPTPRC